MTQAAQVNLRGFENKYYINTGTYESPTWTLVDLDKGTTFNRPPSKGDGTLKKHVAEGYKSTIPGAMDLSINLEVLIPAEDEENAAYDALQEAFLALSSVDILRVQGGLISVDGLKAQRAICAVYDGKISEPADGSPSTQTFELAPVNNDDLDGPQDGTTLSSEFVPTS